MTPSRACGSEGILHDTYAFIKTKGRGWCHRKGYECFAVLLNNSVTSGKFKQYQDTVDILCGGLNAADLVLLVHIKSDVVSYG